MPFIAFIISFAISSLVIPPLILLANRNGAVALPGQRHMHILPTPKLGGVAIALTVLVVSPFIISFDRTIGSYLLSSSLILVIGIIDDIKGAGWKVKLTFCVAATSVFMFGSGIWIKNVGDLFGFGDIHLGLWGIPFTLFSVFGVMNAINLIDGLDGLACGVASIAFMSIAVFASVSGNSTVFYLSLANLGATIGFFRYNYPHARIFMGDSGSLFVGYSLSIMAIMLTQGQGTINPMVPVVILGIPIFDTVRVLSIRIKNKRHPFRADKTHLHHLMLRSDIPQKRVVNTIWLLSLLMSSLAFILFEFESWLMLLILLIVIISTGAFIENLRIIKLRSSRTQ